MDGSPVWWLQGRPSEPGRTLRSHSTSWLIRRHSRVTPSGDIALWKPPAPQIRLTSRWIRLTCLRSSTRLLTRRDGAYGSEKLSVPNLLLVVAFVLFVLAA